MSLLEKSNPLDLLEFQEFQDQSSEKDAIYKVFLKGMGNSDEQEYDLTFFGLEQKMIPLEQFSSFLLAYNDLAQKKKTISISNVKEIIPLGKAEKRDFINFYVILFSQTKEGEMERSGILVGNHKVQGFCVIAIWPLTALEKFNHTISDFDVMLQKIVQHPENYSELILISWMNVKSKNFY